MEISNEITALSVVLTCICTLYAIGFAAYVFIIQKWEIRIIELFFLSGKKLEEKLTTKIVSEVTGKFYIIWGTVFFVIAFYSSVVAILHPEDWIIIVALSSSSLYVCFFIGFVIMTAFGIERMTKKLLEQEQKSNKIKNDLDRE